ncbi:trimeric LpxA-like protein [Phakopsora pachyrhizi]|uniref:mannose-1-phosphate guanylyltransferase n=1 Tax=Phakopsora pachyrhizi TaxID=170000 RepID=A0AAV0AKF3_PHAPC|nr:trimeric LpxA-like protein [Phakopsora pachyrhizi]
MGVQVSKELSTRFGCIVTNPETAQALHYIKKPESFLSNINTGSIFDEIKAAMDLKMKQNASALPAKALVLESYKSNNPVLLRRRSPTIIAAQPPRLNGPTGPEIVEPFYIDKTAVIDPSAKIGPNVSIGANVRIRFGARVRDSIILDNTILEQNSCVLFSILGEDNKIGAWARVEGAPIPLDGTVEKNNISVLAKDVEVKSEVHVRSCIVLPHKSLGRSSAKEVLL